MTVALRPYQTGSLAGIRAAFDRGDRATLVVAATGTGKTVTFAELARIEVSHGLRVLVLVGRDELLKQARRKCEAIGLWPDVEKASARASTMAKVVLASVQSLRGKRLLRWARDHFDLIIVDEAHHVAAKGYQAILAHFDEARVVGFTATPNRADGIALGDTFQSVAYRYDIRDAIREGYLVPVVARRVVVDSVDLSGVTSRAGDFAQDQLSEVMTEARALHGQAVAALEQADDRLAIAFCVDVAHATKFAETLNAYRPGCARAVSGQTDDDERERLLEAHTAGEFQFLTNCDLLVEGYDCLDGETEILTATGWKGRGRVRVGELVQSLNRDTGQLELAPVQRYVARPMRDDERMVTLRSQHVNIRTSERHEFHVRHRDQWHTVEGRGLVGRKTPYALPIAATPSHPPLGVPLTHDELRLIAWFMTDGGFENGRLCISQAKETRDEIRDLLQRLALDFTERVRQPGRGAYPNARPVHVFGIAKGTHSGSLARRGWAKYAPYLDKNVSPLLHAMSIAQFDVFWAELLKGDGSAGQWLWCDRIEQVDAYTRMAIERGRSTSYKPLVTKNGKTVYRVSVRPNQWITSNPSDKRAARAAFEEPSPGEIVWCVTNQNSTLVTRRGGKVAIIGNCPPVSCVIMNRPTKSWGRYVQCAGRGLRPSPETNKRDCKIVDLSGTAGRHRLIGPIDCLRGSDEPEIADDVRDEIDRLLGSAQMPLGNVLELADQEAARRRAALAITAVVKYHAERIDPFIGAGDEPPDDERQGWMLGDARGTRGADRPTQAQLAVLEKHGVKANKLPHSFTAADASRLIGRILSRRDRGLCSFKAAKMLKQHGVLDTANLTHERAKELLDLLRQGNWSSSAIVYEPETGPNHAKAARARAFVQEGDVA